MAELINLLVELDDRFANDAAARERIERAGFALEGYADDRVLAWIDDVFGGAWSSETASAQCVVAMRDGEPAGFAAYDAPDLRYAWLRGAAREPGTGIFGPFGVAPAFRGATLGSLLLQIALCGLRARGYRRALIAAANDGLVPYYETYAGARVVERFDPRAFTPSPPRTVVLASGNGTNVQAVIDAVAAGLPLDLTALVTNRSGAFALERARTANIPAQALVWQRDRQTRAQYDAALQKIVASYDPELVLLLGWMHLLDPWFIEAFPEMLNVHPAFLPLEPSDDTVVMPDGSVILAFRGAHAVRNALAARSPWVGASVHQVTPDTDRGRVYVRKPLRVEAEEDEAAVFARLHPIEHTLVVKAIKRWLFER